MQVTLWKQIVSARGKLFLDFLACTDLTILNGNTVGDLLGEFTCQNYKGCSVVDYIAVNQNVLQDVCTFQVQELTTLSDHKPCSFVINICHNYISGDDVLEAMENCPPRYKFDIDNKSIYQQFVAEQNKSIFEEKIMLLCHKECNSSDDVIKLNKSLIILYQEIADNVIPRTNVNRTSANKRKACKKTHNMKPKQQWFDAACINSKRTVRSLASKYSKAPMNEKVRIEYYKARKAFKVLTMQKKQRFYEELSKDIEAGNNISWSKFKNLKSPKTNKTKLDVFDMINFYKFFKDLYGKQTLSSNRISELKQSVGSTTYSKLATDDLTEMLDQPISFNELQDAINASKKGKAVSEDLICNEFLKASGSNMLNAVLNLYNECLRLGVYPWNTSLVTPLYKKGRIYEPNNYRAIAVASILGKIFSSILLQRLIKFRAENCPDSPNQLGFCKKAQTSDHILTLSTCIDKYINVEKRYLYTCFVDFSKAFDTVSREALMYKIWQLGIRGKFFNCLTYMYENSTAKIKLLNKLSDEIEMLVGTEQGHHMSPELFKCYIQGLSEALNEIGGDVPLISGKKLSHLLWADDLVLLALDPDSLQQLINILSQYCIDWGLTVNMEKTAVMVFNRSGRILNGSRIFKYGDCKIESVKEYCYLGVIFTLTGSFKTAQQYLKQKAMRAYFSLKSIIDFKALKKSTLFKLFDALIVPIATYGCQVWAPETNTFKVLSEDQRENNHKLVGLTKDPAEQLHLSFLKWSLGVGKRTSNAPTWGDTGRIPVIITTLKQTFGYIKRLIEFDHNDTQSLVRFAYEEQINLNLKWYKGVSSMVKAVNESDILNKDTVTPHKFKSHMTSYFISIWNKERVANKKLGFYNNIKSEFGIESYLMAKIKYKEMRVLSKFRMSAHKLHVETGRYHVNRSKTSSKACLACSDNEQIELLHELPFCNELIIEDEMHVLRVCPKYHDLRLALSSSTKAKLFSNIPSIFEKDHIEEVARFIRKVTNRRFPPKQK